MDEPTFPAAVFAAPVSARTLLAGAPLSWTRSYSEHPRIGRKDYAVDVTHRDDAGALLTSLVCLEIDDLHGVSFFDLLEGPALDPTTLDELCADVERALQSGVGVRYQDLSLEAA